MMQVNNKDLLAKLLAVENLQVVRAPVQTASFDIKSRTLVLPQWKEMSVNVEDMLIAHEVGHALFTDMEYLESENFRSLKGYLNVIEDVRIERKMKDKYPGLRKSFTLGYKELNERDFFGVKDMTLSSLLLIDRINLYYKAGFNCGVKFNPTEFQFVSRAAKVDTLKEVHALAQEIWDYTKQQLIEQKRQRQESKSEEDLEEEAQEELESWQNEYDDLGEDEYKDLWNADGEDDDELLDDLPDSSMEHPTAEDAEDMTAISSTKFDDPVDPTQVTEDELDSKTARILRERLQELADTETIVRNYKVNYVTSYIDDNDIIVPYKYIYQDMAQSIESAFEDYEIPKEQRAKHFIDKKANAIKFKEENNRIVNYLVKEFEMRKSASEYVRTKESKSGQLNSSKLAVYKFSDDIFKKFSEVMEDKNHGMIFLVDWSGSMCDYIDDTIRQVVLLAMFCQKIQIPYHVYAFSDGFRYNNQDERTNWDKVRTGDKDSFAIYNTNLLEFFSHKMTTTEFNRAVEYMLDRPYRITNYQLNGTPLNESLFYLTDYIGKFKSMNNLEKIHLITLTDGDASGASPVNGSMSTMSYETGERRKVINVINDHVTKKQYRIHDNRMDQTKILLSVIKDRYNCTLIGFYLGKATNKHILSFVRNNTSINDLSISWALVDEIRTSCRKNQFSLVPSTGRDEFYYLPVTNMKIQDEELEVSKDMSSKQIARAFNKYLNIQKTNRVLLNRFVGMIA